ncbi:hypothetical protein KC336_g36 [Hortaea werneckii]|nr:hypothetical protein KC336_g36 [Hortaea werneckii]
MPSSSAVTGRRKSHPHVVCPKPLHTEQPSSLVTEKKCVVNREPFFCQMGRMKRNCRGHCLNCTTQFVHVLSLGDSSIRRWTALLWLLAFFSSSKRLGKMVSLMTSAGPECLTLKVNAFGFMAG